MQALKSAARNPRVRHLCSRAAVALTLALDQSTRRPPLAAWLLSQLAF